MNSLLARLLTTVALTALLTELALLLDDNPCKRCITPSSWCSLITSFILSLAGLFLLKSLLVCLLLSLSSILPGDLGICSSVTGALGDKGKAAEWLVLSLLLTSPFPANDTSRGTFGSLCAGNSLGG